MDIYAILAILGTGIGIVTLNYRFMRNFKNDMNKSFERFEEQQNDDLNRWNDDLNKWMRDFSYYAWEKACRTFLRRKGKKRGNTHEIFEFLKGFNIAVLCARHITYIWGIYRSNINGQCRIRTHNHRILEIPCFPTQLPTRKKFTLATSISRF